MYHILYVDDESSLLEVVKLFLEKSGDFAVTTATNALEGIRLIELEKFDAVISDYQMPNMDGIQFLVEVRKRFGSIPFILFTGRGREEVVIQAINKGADFYLQKGGEPKAQFAELSHKVKQATSRKMAEEALREGEKKYRHLIEHSDEAIIVVQDGIAKLVNHRTIEFTGYSEQEVQSMSIFTFVHPDDRAMVMERYQKRMKSGESPTRYAFRVCSKDGSTKWAEINISIIDWEGRPATLNFLTDITERRQAEDALRESEYRYRMLIENANEAIFVIQDGRICFANPKLEQIGKYTMEELSQKPFLEFVHPDDRAIVGEQHKQRIAGKPLNDNYAFRIVTKEGSVLWMEINASLITWNGRQAVLVLLSDITRRKFSEEALKESEGKFRALVDQSLDGIVIVDFLGNLLFANNSAAKLTGYDLDVVGKMNVLDIISPEFRIHALSDFARVVAGTDSYLVKYKILNREKKELWIECIGKKISFAGSSAMILSIRDITGRQWA